MESIPYTSSESKGARLKGGRYEGNGKTQERSVRADAALRMTAKATAKATQREAR